MEAVGAFAVSSCGERAGTMGLQAARNARLRIAEAPTEAPAVNALGSNLPAKKPVQLFPIGTASRAFYRRFYPGTGAAEWNDWRWQVQRRIRTLDDLSRVFRLSEDERDAAARHTGALPVGITPYYASLMGLDDPAEPLNSRARAYLDVNCGNCHHPKGPANSSGLFLNFDQQQSVQFGIMKSPVAAGRGAGKNLFDIVPGKPDQSILTFRMQTNDPGIAMPELGREQVHTEAVTLIRDWISNMKN